MMVPEPSIPGVNATKEKTWRQLAAEDPRFQSSDPLKALEYASPPFQYENDPVYRAGRSTREGLQHWLQNSRIPAAIKSGPLPGALLAGGLAAAAGGLGGIAANVGINGYNMATGARKKRVDAIRLAMMLGLVGAGVGAYSGWMGQNKAAGFRESAGWRDNDPYSIILNELRDARTLSFNEQAQLMRGVTQLDPAQAASLARTLKMAGGAAIGAIVARFLAGAGLGGMVLGGLIGGTVAKSLMVRRDAFGRSY